MAVTTGMTQKVVPRSLPLCHVLALFIGGPKTLVDARGEWRSSIARGRVDGPARLEICGFVGDQATQSYHESPEIAVCIHAQSHYDFWNTTHDLNACFYHQYDAALAERFISAEGLMDWWKQRLRDKGTELNEQHTIAP